MAENIPTSLLRLARDKAEISQSLLAQAMNVSNSVLSRLEATEETEITVASRYLEAVGTDFAKEVALFYAEAWTHFARPPFLHPERHLLRGAEEAFSSLDKFVGTAKYDAVLDDLISQLRTQITREAAFLSGTDHVISFIGPIGVGKTTALSAICNLMLTGSSVFPTGSGRTTVCEVAIQTAPAFGIAVESMSTDEIRRLVTELVHGVASNKGGLPSELDRLIRNMGKVRRVTSRGETPGKLVTTDQMKELIARSSDLDQVVAEVIDNMNLEQRAQNQMIMPDDSQNGLEWLASNISKINYGQHPAFSVPQRIAVLVPDTFLRSSPYRISIVDTKGVEGTTQRSDLDKQRDDGRTLCVVCTKFADAPGAVALSFIKEAVDAGSDAIESGRISLLVLPRADEALQVVDDTGNRAQSTLEGYAIRESQVLQQFSTEGLPSVPCEFFKVGEDEPIHIWSRLNEQIENVRIRRMEFLESALKNVSTLITNSEPEKTKQARRIISELIAGAAQRLSTMPPSVRPAHGNLVAEAKKAHQSSIAASASRRGDWDTFSIPHILGVGMRIDANLRTRDSFVRIDEQLASLEEKYKKLSDIVQFLRTLRLEASEWKREFLARAAVIGSVSYANYLERADTLWRECQERYGKGAGYRVDVSDIFESHFDNDAGATEARKRAERSLESAWNQLVLDPLVKAVQY